MFDCPSCRPAQRPKPNLLWVALGLLLMAATLLLAQEPTAEPSPEDGATSQEAVSPSEEEGEDTEEGPPPAPPPPDGILPVGEVARFEHSPRDRPSTLFVGDYLIVSTRSGIVQGIDALTGENVWKLGLPGEELFPPVALPPPAELTILLSTPDGHLFFVDTVSGRIESEKRLSLSLALEPFVSEANVLYAGTPDGVVHGYDLESDTALFATETGEVPNALAASSRLLAVSGAGQTLTALDPRTGSVQWTHRGRGPFISRASFDRNGERLYIGSDTGEFYCLEAGNGRVKFSWPTGASIRSPALVEGDRVYVTSYGNALYAYGAGNGHEQWRARLPGRPASGAVRIYARFMVATQDGRLVEIVPQRGHVSMSYAAPGEIPSAPAFHIVARPPLEATEPSESEPVEALPADDAEESDPDDELAVAEPEEPKWYELSRIAITLKSGQVLLLAHQPPEPEEPEESEEVEGIEGDEDGSEEPPGDGSPVPF